MKFEQVRLSDGTGSFDVVVVIDVCRAFTTAAFALAAGAARIILVPTVEEALELRRLNPEWRLVGESGGLPVDGFDHWNSPFEMEAASLNGRTLVQRTSAGTQGVALYRAAGVILAGSFVVAGATVAAIRALSPASVGFVVTGVRPPDFSGAEDVACADYMQALLEGRHVSPEPYLKDAMSWDPQRVTLDPLRLQHLQEDLVRCLQVDRFDFPMRVRNVDGQMVLEGLGH